MHRTTVRSQNEGINKMNECLHSWPNSIYATG